MLEYKGAVVQNAFLNFRQKLRINEARELWNIVLLPYPQILRLASMYEAHEVIIELFVPEELKACPETTAGFHAISKLIACEVRIVALHWLCRRGRYI